MEQVTSTNLTEMSVSANLNPRQRSRLDKLVREWQELKRGLGSAGMEKNYNIALIRRIKAKQEEIMDFMTAPPEAHGQFETREDLEQLANEQLAYLKLQLDILVIDEWLTYKRVNEIIAELEEAKQECIDKAFKHIQTKHHKGCRCLPIVPVSGTIRPRLLMLLFSNSHIDLNEEQLGFLDSCISGLNFWDVGIHYGEEKNFSPVLAQKEHLKNGRRSLTIASVIALALHSDILRGETAAVAALDHNYKTGTCLRLSRNKERLVILDSVLADGLVSGDVPSVPLE